jgi:hypothetical protein
LITARIQAASRLNDLVDLENAAWQHRDECDLFPDSKLPTILVKAHRACLSRSIPEGRLAMQPQNSLFPRNLLIVLVLLFVLSLAGLNYGIWTVEPGLDQWWMLLLNILITSIPLVLLYGSIYVLLAGWHERATLGKVSPRLAKTIHWAPRVAALMIIFFVGLFSLDVFGIGASPLDVLVGFLMHNLPSIAMLVLSIFAWKRPVVGFVAFLIVGAAFTILFVRDLYALPNLVLFVLPILLIASLFYADWQWLKP